MSAGQQMLVSAGGFRVANGATFEASISAAVGASTALSSSFTSAGAYSSVSSPANWFTPNVTGIGSSYWIRVTRSSGNVFTTGTEGTWLSLSAGQAFGWTSTTQARSWIGTAEFAIDSGGATIVGTNTLNMLIDRI